MSADDLRVLREEKQALVTTLVTMAKATATAESALAAAEARIAVMERDLELAQTWIKNVNDTLWMAHHAVQETMPSANQLFHVLELCAGHRQRK